MKLLLAICASLLMASWPSSIAESQLSAFQDRGYDTTTISNSSTA